uniref:Ig-like domain-containing protein n=1 Tax=Acanthochromis polyacanthus TaxID=80966 RepID=A0A3Q1F4I2_9TELE
MCCSRTAGHGSGIQGNFSMTLPSCHLPEPPYFLESLEPMEVTAGDAVCLKCQVAGTPEIKVSWFKADGKVRSSPTCKLEYSKGVACLKLSKASKADVGEYTCKAENRIGSASSTCRLNNRIATLLSTRTYTNCRSQSAGSKIKRRSTAPTNTTSALRVTWLCCALRAAR